MIAATVDDYIAGFPDDVQRVLKEIRATIKKVAPEAQEGISYQIPTFKLNSIFLIYFAGFKKHVSLYPILSECPGFEDELAPYRSGRATAKFPLDQPIPFALISKIVTFMKAENIKRAEAKAAKSKSARDLDVG
jgi:uncharacterized protein YdhG (YjbR/CyaY superfamily)